MGTAHLAEDLPWYHEGLRFSCVQCGDCCCGEPGTVAVSDDDIARLAEALGLSVQRFVDEYTRGVSGRRRLYEFPDGDCVLFDSAERTCKAYEARPLQCRTWPFWRSNLIDAAAWKQTCEVCPGCGTGELHMGPIVKRKT